MPKLSTSRKAKIAARTVRNIVTGKPITVSYEVTYSCNANCEHCDLGGYIRGEPKSPPEAFARWITELRPVVAQISGGEPLIRKDLVDIIRAMRARDPLPVFVLTTNVTILNEKRYHMYREAGVDQWSFSLDYPDERHNEYRHLHKNFEHIRDLCRKLSKYDNDDIVLACVVQRDNMHDLPRMAELASEWGVAVNFSTYNALRTGKDYYMVSSEEDLATLTNIVDRLVEMQKDGYPILTSEWTMRQMIHFFRTGRQPDCQAGKRFMIVGPTAQLTPCGMVRDTFDSPKELVNAFSANNRCEQCFTAIRANSEKSLYRLMVDALQVVRH
ncbi:MAG: radical SAM protein [Candidatus Zixiibacteriota bacterium]|nr:MAG: radical SAM protein [candidate division Zixibacteria bacterium]